MGKVFISPNIVKQSDRIDTTGNIINPVTKQIIKKNEPEFVVPTQEIEQAHTAVEAPYIAPQAPTTQAISIIEQIRQAKENLIQLEELKKIKIAEKKAELELLEQ